MNDDPYKLSAALREKMSEEQFALIAEAVRQIDNKLLTGAYNHAMVREILIPEITASEDTKKLILETLNEVYIDEDYIDENLKLSVALQKKMGPNFLAIGDQIKRIDAVILLGADPDLARAENAIAELGVGPNTRKVIRATWPKFILLMFHGRISIRQKTIPMMMMMTEWPPLQSSRQKGQNHYQAAPRPLLMTSRDADGEPKRHPPRAASAAPSPWWR